MPGLNDLAPKLPFGRRSARLSRRWQAETGDHVIAMAWSPGGTLLAAASVGGPITILDAATGAIRHTLPGHGFGTTAVGWNADGAHFASAGQDAQVRLWDLAAGRERLTLDGGEAWVERLTWHPRENLLACAAGRRLRLWEPQGRLVREYPAHASTISDLCWRPGSTDLTSASYGAVTLWSPEGEEPLRRFQWKGSVLALAWSPDGKYLATGDQDSTVHFWIYRTGEDLQMSGYPTKVRELSWSADGRFLATGGGPLVTVWDCSGKGPEGSTPLSFKGHEQLVRVLAFQRSGPLLASGGADGRVFLWAPGKAKKSLARGDLGSEVVQIAWSPDDRRLAAGCASGRTAVYDLG